MLIKIPNDSFNEFENDTYLTPDELVVFAFLFKYRNLDDEVWISLNLLDHIFKFKKGNDQENKAFIRTVVEALIKKDFIISEQKKFIDKEEVKKDKTKDTDLIYAKIRNDKKEDKKGYCGVESSVFDELHKKNDMLEFKLKFYIYTYIHCYGTTGRKVSVEKLSSLCSYFESTKHYSITKLKEVINDMDGKIIYRFSGDRKENSPEQEANTYYTELDEKKKQEYLNHVHNKEEKKKEHDVAIPVVSDEEINWGHWKDGNLKYEDYLLYVQQEHIPEFKKVANAKIKRITSNGTNENAKYVVDKNLEEARDEILRQRLKEIKNTNEQIMNELIEEYGVCIKLKDGYYRSHLDVPDWNSATHFVYVSISGSVCETTISDSIEFFSSELVKHQFLSKELVNGEFKDKYNRWRKKNTVSDEYEPDRSITYVKIEKRDDISQFVQPKEEKPIWMTMFDEEELTNSK